MISINQVLIAVALLSTVVSIGYVNGFRFPMAVTERIRGGQEAAIGQFPFAVSVQLKKHGVPYEHTCGGSIITNRFVLTVANCFDRRYQHRYRVVVGAHNLTTSGTAYHIDRWIIHERFDVNMSTSNIALIQVEKIKFNPVKLISPIPLGSRTIRGGGTAVVAGWGKNYNQISNLEFMRMTTMSNDECRKHFKAAKTEKTPVHDFETICAIPGKHGHLIRDGQSGDALTYENRVIGLLAWEQPPSGEKAVLLPVGFTRISTHLEWINERLKWAE